MTDHEDPDAVPTEPTADEDGTLIDELRGSGVGTEDEHIVGDPSPGLVDEQVAKDEPPVV